jgi:hypothetical protein
MSCESLENLLAQIDSTIANFSPSNHRYSDSMKKQAEGFRAAARYMNQEVTKVLRKK